MKSTTANRPGQTGFPSVIDKLNVRRSTPDSEALASSDDEADTHRQEPPAPSALLQKTGRRASWLNDTTQPLSQPRKGSFASSSMSPTASHPSTPSAESGAWSAHGPPSANAPVGRGHAGTLSFPWGTGIWNAGDSRKEPPSRLTEVLASPTSLLSPGSNGSGIHFSPRETTNQDSSLPFAIPLHPTPKTYRSQSYSVGQLESDASQGPGASFAPTGFTGRGRGGLPHPSALHHRPSRPSMLSEMSGEGMGLSKLKEVDDDEDASESTTLRSRLEQNRLVEELARENAILKQQQQHQQQQQQQQQVADARSRSRSISGQTGSSAYSSTNIYSHHAFVPEGSDYAIDELDEISELQDITNRGMPRRMSEYGARQDLNSINGTIENRKLESVKKATWQSSLGFGGLEDIPQSRRHSFADVSARHGSVTSASDVSRAAQAQEHILNQDRQDSYLEGSKYAANDHLPLYLGGGQNQARGIDPYVGGAYPASVYNAYGAAPQYGNGRSASPHRNMYGVPQARHNQLLYIVLFKCSRADVFYVQEGTGLSVKPGDLVIVEADRGTDLGTVAHDDVDWTQAKDLKEHYAEEHYKWLMMYSQGAAGTSDGTGAGLMAASNGLQGSAVGGMGPPNQHGMQEPVSGELKPKIIKRLAQQHEVQALRDKEGNEAKAKRVCMQKVKEHGLHMEILDAEFQMDWKKLTFYYFADAYINFNSLVTDLFKVYKTRIWMSAINPASFASPSVGLQAPSGIGPGAIGINRPAQTDRRQQQDQSMYASNLQAGRTYAGGVANTFPSHIDIGQMPTTSFGQANFAPYGYSFGVTPRNGLSGMYQSSMLQGMDPYTGYQSQQRYGPSHDNVQESASSGNDAWVTSMQSLSLNSR